MHEDTVCPSRDSDSAIAQQSGPSSPDKQQTNHDLLETFGHTSNRSSLDLSLRYPDKNLILPPPSTQVASSYASNQSLPAAVYNSRQGRYARWKTSWRLQTVVLGFYFLALVLAAAHCWFFLYLDGRILSPDTRLSAKTTTMPQGYVTTISLLLTTSFRAALLASIGTCYTQYLWATLRDRFLKVSLIENLFQLQTNAFHLTSPSVYMKTPLLAAIAAFCWSVPIATVYPPGALVVELQDLSIDTKLNVSVFHTNDILKNPKWTSLSAVTCNQRTVEFDFPNFLSQAQNTSYLRTCRLDSDRERDLTDIQFLSVSSLISGELATLPQPAGDNSSYNVDFWGPILNCQSSNLTFARAISNAELNNSTTRTGGWSVPKFFTSCMLRSNTASSNFSTDPPITFRTARSSKDTYHYHPCVGTNMSTVKGSEFINVPKPGIDVYVPVSETVCRPEIVRYSVNISNNARKQNIHYTIRRDESLPVYSPSFKDFTGTFDQWVQFSDAMAVFSEFARNLNKTEDFVSTPFFEHPNPTEQPSPYTTNDGTTVDACLLGTRSLVTSYENSDIWQLSIFRRRIPGSTSFSCSFDPEMAKALLINTTISALGLNKRFAMVDGSTSRAFNVYHFQNKPAFFLPYGLSLGLGIPIIALGLVAFYVQNQGVSAITGGFLQILMTTTGRTALETAIMKGSGTMGGQENVSKELKDMKIRFGELVECEGGEREKSYTLDTCSNSEGEYAIVSYAAEHENTLQQTNIDLTPETDVGKEERAVPIRAGFGTRQEVRPLRGRRIERK